MGDVSEEETIRKLILPVKPRRKPKSLNVKFPIKITNNFPMKLPEIPPLLKMLQKEEIPLLPILPVLPKHPSEMRRLSSPKF